jgi:hypothetical protein
MSADDMLSIADIEALTGDDIAYWLNNPFVSRGYIVGKIRFWVTKSVAASIARAAAEWSQRVNEGLSASVLAAKAEAWDEGYSHCFDAGPDPDDVRSLRDNPYRDQP